jgi:hypothetical protein
MQWLIIVVGCAISFALGIKVGKHRATSLRGRERDLCFGRVIHTWLKDVHGLPCQMYAVVFPASAAFLDDQMDPKLVIIPEKRAKDWVRVGDEVSMDQAGNIRVVKVGDYAAAHS